MNLRLLPLVALMAIMISCSKDDDATPTVENAKFSFADQEEVITIPEALMESEDMYANSVASAVMQANALSQSMLQLLTPPEGATKSTTEIVAVNGRVARTAGSVVVYTWSDGQNSIAYQVKDLSDSYVFELFFTLDGEWVKYFEASEKKDKSAGHMIIYDFFSEESSILGRWDWTRSGDTFNFTFTDLTYTKWELTINTKTQAGSIKSYWGITSEGGTTTWELSSEITWEADGSGTWKEYSDGELLDEGTFGS